MRPNSTKSRPTPKNFRDLTGQIFNRLTVVRRGPTKPNWQVTWECACQCGQIVFVGTNYLLHGKVKSCGCWRREARFTHGLSGTPEYRSWINMIQRATNLNRDPFKWHAGRGISVCERWRKFENFYADMGPKPSPIHSVERRDNDADYGPDNCYWATPPIQSRNTRRNVWITFQGKTLCLTDWAILVGISYTSLKKRLKNWPIERALTEPVHQHNVHKKLHPSNPPPPHH